MEYNDDYNMAAAAVEESTVNDDRKRKRATSEDSEDRENEDEATDVPSKPTKSTHRPTKIAKSSDEWHNQRLEEELAGLNKDLEAARQALDGAKKDVTEAKKEVADYESKYEKAKKEEDGEERLARINDLVNTLRDAWNESEKSLTEAKKRLASRAKEVEAKAKEVEAIEGVLMFQKSLLTLDCQGCRLSSEFLEKNDLQSYVDGTIACQGKDDVKEVLDSLDFDESNTHEGHISPFVSIVASSGTGKTQLAATAAQTQHVCYFYTGASAAPNLQKFYEAHKIVSENMEKCLDKFWLEIFSFLEPGPQGKHPECPPAGQIQKFFRSEEVTQRMIALPLLSLLGRCLLGDDVCLASFDDLRKRIIAVKKDENKKFFVFMDEVPRAGSRNFGRAILLRNVLRALGLCPILMSTHGGAMNAIPKGSDSREEETWCRLIVKLPNFHAGNEVFEKNKWLCSTERPLVAALMVDHDEKEDLTNIVEHVKGSLEKRKPEVWGSPLLQLCQLMRTKPEPDKTGRCLGEYNHEVCGVHFGRVTLKDGAISIDLGRKQSPGFVKKAKVAFVDPEIEPVLFLAITAWKGEYLDDGTSGAFPLVSETDPISVRQTCELEKEFFEERVRQKNPNAKKRCGDLLEVLALASVTLASLHYKEKVDDTTCLSDFLAYTHHFMCPGKNLNAQDMQDDAADIGTMLERTEFSSISVPTCCCVESNVAEVWDNGVWGKLERPPDSNQRDGELKQSDDKHLLHIECKNYEDGLGTKAFKEIITRMNPNKAKVTLIFTTTLNGLFHEPTWQQVYKKNDARHHCVMVLEKGGGTPRRNGGQRGSSRWLKVGKGQLTELRPGPDCKALIVVIATGPV